MSTSTALIIAALLVGAVYTWKSYQEAQAKKAAASQWNTVIKAGTAILGWL